MSPSRARRTPTLEDLRTELSARLRERTPEIEETILACVRTISPEAEHEDIEYSAGQREAVAAAVAYSLAGVEHEPSWREPIPSAVAAQARRAAGAAVSLDTVLRRCMAGDRCFGEFILDAAEGLPSEAVRQVIRAQGAHVDRLAAFVSAEYAGEMERLQRSPSRHLAEWVQGLLGGEDPADVNPAGYRFDAWHLALIASGVAAGQRLQGMAARLESQALIVPRADGTVWVWLGRRRPLAFAEVERQMNADLHSQLRLAVGESRPEIAGWRLTHREAQAAHQVMSRQPRKLVRCGHVALPAALLRDELLRTSLLETHLAPLDGRGSEGAVLRETLRAYFATDGNVAAAAATLDVSRHTIHRRLRKVEQRLGRLLEICRVDLEMALMLEELLDSPSRERDV